MLSFQYCQPSRLDTSRLTNPGIKEEPGHTESSSSEDVPIILAYVATRKRNTWQKKKKKKSALHHHLLMIHGMLHVSPSSSFRVHFYPWICLIPRAYMMQPHSPLLSAGLCCEAKLASTESCITLSPVQDSIKDNQMRSSQLAPCLDNVLREHFQKGRTKYKHGETTTHVLLLFCYIHCVLLTKASNPREREGRGGQQKARIHNSWLLLLAIVQ